MAANMETVVATHETMIEFIQAGITPVLHQFGPQKDRVDIVRKVSEHAIDRKKFPLANCDREGRPIIAAAVRFTGAAKAAEELIHAGASIIVLDSANGYTPGFHRHIASIRAMADTVKRVRDSKHGEHIVIIAGNVATAEGVYELAKSGADGIKVGIGSGFGCGTGHIGVHVPQLTALAWAHQAASENGATIISDGGIRTPYDYAVALTFSHAVMMGSVLAATIESSAEKKKDKDGTLYANYRGSASNEARRRRSTAHPDDHTFNSYEVNEGYDGWIKVSGSIEDFVTHYNNTLRVVMWYVGVTNLTDLRSHAKLLQLSPESHKDLMHKISSYQLEEQHTNGKRIVNSTMNQIAV